LDPQWEYQTTGLAVQQRFLVPAPSFYLQESGIWPINDVNEGQERDGDDSSAGKPYDPAGSELSMGELLREIEGSTHGGPRHAALFESLKRNVAAEPAEALDVIERSPSSARSVLLMAVSGLGRRVLGDVLARLSHPNANQRSNAAMILCIWATRGLLSGADRDAIEQARIRQPVPDQADRFVDDALGRLRT